MFFSLISCILSEDSFHSLKIYLYILPVIFIPLFSLLKVDYKYFQKIFIPAILISSSILSLWGICQYYNIIEYPYANIFGSRISASFSNPNHLASFLGAIFILIYTHLLNTRNHKHKIILLIILILAYTNIFFAGTRGIWFSLIITFLLIFIILAKYSLSTVKENKRWIITTLVAFTIITILYSIPSPIRENSTLSLTERFLSSKEILKATTTKDFSIRERLFIWEITLNIIENYPIWGTGPGSYESMFKTFKDNLSKEQSFSKKYPPEIFKNYKKYAHNEYLHIWSESGIFSLFAFILFLSLLIFQIFKKLIYNNAHIALLGITLSIMTILIYSLVSYPLHNNPTNLIFWCLISICIINTAKEKH